MSYLNACLGVLLWTSLSLAQVHVPRVHHVPNYYKTHCAWASAETAALARGYYRARGLAWKQTQRSPLRGGVPYGATSRDLREVEARLREYRIPVRACRGSKRKCFLWSVRQVRKGKPVIVSYVPRPGKAHAVVLTDVSKRKVYYIDSQRTGRVSSMDRSRFYGRMIPSALSVGSRR